MIRTTRISLLSLSLIGSCAHAGTLDTARAVLRTVNNYAPVIALGTAVSCIGGVWYIDHRRQNLCRTCSTAREQLDQVTQDLRTCKNWADKRCLPALKLLRVDQIILDNPSTWATYCATMDIEKVKSCVYQLNRSLDIDELIREFSAGYEHAQHLFAQYKQAHRADRQANSSIYYSEYDKKRDQALAYCNVMVPEYLRKVGFLKMLFQTRSQCIKANLKNQCCTCPCSHTCHS